MVVVPDGKVPGTSTSWKQFCFVSLHAHAGAHFAPDKTLALLARACWWEHMRRDVLMWCDRCWQCLQYRRRPDRAPAGCHVSYTQRPWQDVMIDCEGPSSPADIATGARYVLTLRCAMCGGVKLESLERLEQNHFRRAFIRCVFKTGTIPETIRTDRGPEVANAAMDEIRNLMGSRRILGHAFRPTSQAPVERAHQETQRLLGITVHGVFKAFPGEWGELLPVVEFLLYNTPQRNTGLTLRDLDKAWSLSTSLERELMPFTTAPDEPISDMAQRLFGDFRKLQRLVKDMVGKEAKRAQELANRHRPDKLIQSGDRVLWWDPKMTKERAGRTPWKRALVGPGTVLAAPGRRLDIRTDDGVIIRDAHLDDVLVIPDEVDDWEKEPLALGPGEPDRLPRSPGQMIEQAGRGVTPQDGEEGHQRTGPHQGHRLQHWPWCQEVFLRKGHPLERPRGDGDGASVCAHRRQAPQGAMAPSLCG